MPSGPGVWPVAIYLIIQNNSVFVIGLVRSSLFCKSSIGVIPFKNFFANCGYFGFSLNSSQKKVKGSIQNFRCGRDNSILVIFKLVYVRFFS